MSSNDITAKSLMQLVERQKYRCALSGRALTPDCASLDHKMPLAKGGKHAMSNLWVLHRDVNAAKGTMTVNEFVAICRDVVRTSDKTGQAGLPGGGHGSFPEECIPNPAGSGPRERLCCHAKNTGTAAKPAG